MAASQEHYDLPLPAFDKAPNVLIVRAPYYKAIGDELFSGAQGVLTSVGATHDLVDVPGALEIPTAIALWRSKYDGFVALGCIIRGETTHYDTVCNDSSRGLMQLGLEGLCIGNGILTVENMAQAQARAEAAGQNKGGGAAAAALHLFAQKTAAGRASKRAIGFAPKSQEFQIAAKD